MAFYHEFDSSRTTEADFPSLQAQLVAFDATALLGHTFGTKIYTVSKSTAWTAPQITGAMSVINNAPAVTDNLMAQNEIDTLRIAINAIVFSLVDEINILRNLHSLAPRTYQGAIAVIRSKAGSL